MKRLFLLLLCALLMACAPVAVLRTPKPLEEGQTRFSVGLAYGINLVPIPACPQGDIGCFESFRAYLPLPSAFQFSVQRGVGGKGELVGSLEMGPLPGLRVGYKHLWLGQPILLAGDIGGSLYGSGGVFDLGLLGSWPQGDWEPYFAIRGFYTQVWGGWSALTAGITAGGRVPLGSSDLFLELTLSNSVFSGAPPSNSPTGWTITPAIGFRF